MNTAVTRASHTPVTLTVVALTNTNDVGAILSTDQSGGGAGAGRELPGGEGGTGPAVLLDNHNELLVDSDTEDVADEEEEEEEEE